MTRTRVPANRRRLAAIAGAFLMHMALGAPAAAMQILDATDHGELAAEISATDVNRIALAGDRIAKVVRAPDGFAVEHDAASGDLYLRPAVSGGAGTLPGAGEPVTLFVGTERGFTYRLTLIPRDRGSAQILIRNASVLPGTVDPSGIAGPAAGTDAHVAALVRLVRAVARREPVHGYEILAGGGAFGAGLRLIETWRGPRLAAHVLEADRDAPGPAALAGTIGALPGFSAAAEGARLAALWLAAPGTGPSGGRLAVVVTEAAGGPR